MRDAGFEVIVLLADLTLFLTGRTMEEVKTG